ncbi:Hsp70 family protein [Streptomyces sp. NPDC005492]|uniref:Hsp70 family protein n=1 Tax=Streptomyces sp. NPDC005492 TaxID=3156883 RepID=UPI00339DBAED
MNCEGAAEIGTVPVYNLGGGTFDVTVMRVEDGDYTVIATDGDPNLGGFDWTCPPWCSGSRWAG